MALRKRIPALVRWIWRPSTIRYLLLTASDPRHELLFKSQAQRTAEDRMTSPSLWFAWRSVPAVERFLAVLEKPFVLEWGSGGSTAWFAAHGADVVSIEHDKDWFDTCSRYLNGRADVRFAPSGDEYLNPDVDWAAVNCIVIDGVMRVECALVVADKVQSGAIRLGTLVIFDNSEREIYDEGIARLEEVCTRWRSFSGPTGLDIDQMTTLFYV